MVKRDDLITPDTLVEITSGGIQEKGKPLPALYASKELASAAFQREMDLFLANTPATFWKMVHEPVADRWQITITDTRNMHRIAEERWSVTATIGTWLTTAKVA